MLDADQEHARLEDKVPCRITLDKLISNTEFKHAGDGYTEQRVKDINRNLRKKVNGFFT